MRRSAWKGPACLPWALALLLAIPLQALAADPLPSWNDGPVKQSIIDFVTRATTEGGPGYIPPEERIATFDNDGTLWQEQPVVQDAFLLEQVKARVKEDASLAKRQPFKAVLEGDVALLSSMEEPQLMELFAATHAGKTQDAFAREARLDHLNDKAGKPVGIEQRIGRRPAFAAGNVRSGGDIQMLQYTKEQPRPGFSLLIHHDDAEREFAYQEKNDASLKAAREGGWAVVSMRQDWKHIFPEEGR